MKKLLNVVLVVVMVLAAAMSVQAQAELVVKDESDYVHMTMDELYQEALKEAAEGKTLVAYSNSSSVSKSASLFMEAYPGITVVASQPRLFCRVSRISVTGRASPARQRTRMTSSSESEIFGASSLTIILPPYADYTCSLDGCSIAQETTVVNRSVEILVRSGSLSEGG